MSSPHMPANMPIGAPRVVRGDAVMRLPGAVAAQVLPFSHHGVVSTLSESPPWVISTATTYTECVVGFLVVDQIEFDIKVNGTGVESIACSTGSPQSFAISVAVVRDDEVTIEITDVDGGLADGVSVILRFAV